MSLAVLLAGLAPSCLTPDAIFESPSTTASKEEEPPSDSLGGGSGTPPKEDHCENSVADSDETDVNCGGKECSPCSLGRQCLANTDCENDECTGGKCQDANCVDRMQNGDETDVDCGGTACAPCAPDLRCLVKADCASHVCDTGLCATPSCEDRTQNGGETDIDCGGSCARKCDVNEACVLIEDCAQPGEGTAFVDCKEGVCSPSCNNKADCDDANLCTDNECVDGLCVKTNNSAPCATDGNRCSEDVCAAGECTHEALPLCSQNTVILRASRDDGADQWLSLNINSLLVWNEVFDAESAALFDKVSAGGSSFYLQHLESGAYVTLNANEELVATGTLETAATFKTPACSFEGNAGVGLQVTNDDDSEDFAAAEGAGTLSVRSGGCSGTVAGAWERFEVVALAL